MSALRLANLRAKSERNTFDRALTWALEVVFTLHPDSYWRLSL